MSRSTVMAGDDIRSATRNPLYRRRMALLTSPVPRSRSDWLITPHNVPSASTTGRPLMSYRSRSRSASSIRASGPITTGSIVMKSATRSSLVRVVMVFIAGLPSDGHLVRQPIEPACSRDRPMRPNRPALPPRPGDARRGSAPSADAGFHETLRDARPTPVEDPEPLALLRVVADEEVLDRRQPHLPEIAKVLRAPNSSAATAMAMSRSLR